MRIFSNQIAAEITFLKNSPESQSTIYIDYGLGTGAERSLWNARLGTLDAFLFDDFVNGAYDWTDTLGLFVETVLPITEVVLKPFADFEHSMFKIASMRLVTESLSVNLLGGVDHHFGICHYIPHHRMSTTVDMNRLVETSLLLEQESPEVDVLPVRIVGINVIIELPVKLKEITLLDLQSLFQFIIKSLHNGKNLRDPSVDEAHRNIERISVHFPLL